MQRHAAPDARERIPTGVGGAARSYHFYGAYPFLMFETHVQPRRAERLPTVKRFILDLV